MNSTLTSIAGITIAILFAALIALAGSQNGLEAFGLPIFIGSCLLAFTIQWLMFIPAFIFQTERFYDLTGSLTYIALVIIGLSFSSFEPGSILIAVMVAVWAVRLGSFLFMRVTKAGHDSRFRSIKPDFFQYLMTWTLQGLWVFLTFAAGLAAITSDKPHPIDLFAIIGGTLWLAGFAIEVTADNQKSQFKSDPANADRFISQGLWALSRHPNYFGEILLWIGIAVIALPILEGWQYATLISPLFVIFLLTRVSGVRMLENQARKRWGNDPDYQAYFQRTPMLLLNPFLKKATT